MEKDIPGYETFKQVKRKWFSVSNLIVYYPPNSNDPRMSKDQRKQGLESAHSTCLLIKQQRLQCPSEAKLLQLKQQMNEHIDYITKDRQMYRQRTDVAIKQPFLKMSVITDKSGSFQLPQYHPMPKDWANINMVQASFVGFINHGLNKKELVFFKESDYIADADFYISLLFNHLKESLL